MRFASRAPHVRARKIFIGDKDMSGMIDNAKRFAQLPLSPPLEVRRQPFLSQLHAEICAATAYAGPAGVKGMSFGTFRHCSLHVVVRHFLFATGMTPDVIQVKIFPGVDHDFMNADPHSMDCLRTIFVYVDEQLKPPPDSHDMTRA